MTGSIHLRGKVRTFTCFLLSLWITFPVLSIAENSILIIKSSDNAFFNTTIERLINNTQTQTKFNIHSLESLKKDLPSELQANAIITLGFKAAQFTNDLKVTTPIIHSYMTEFQHFNHQAVPQHTSLLLEQPLERYAMFVKILLEAGNIGIIKPENDKISVHKLEALQQKLNLTINQSLFKKGDNPVNTVRRLLEKNDVLLTLPAPEVYNRQSLKGILLTSYRLNKPVISYAPSHVKSGALAAIYTSPGDIGNQLADLVTKLLNQKDFKLQPYYYASDFNISINKRVAESLNLELADEQEILQRLHQAEAQ